MTADWQLLAIDAGTSSCRVTAFGPGGRELVHYARGYAPVLGPAGTAEQPLEPIWQTVLEGLGQASAAGSAGSSAALGVTAQLGLVLVDAAGEPLGEAITWMDHRADAEAEALVARVGAAPLTRLAGRRASGELLGPKLLWLRRHDAERFSRAAMALTLKDYLLLRLTGARVVDPSHASYSLLFDVREGAWSEPLLRELGLPPELLPPVQPATSRAGGLRPEVAAQTGLPAGLPVAVGGPDGTVGTVGAGMVEPGITVDVAGTSDVVFTAADHPIADPDGRVVVNCHAIPGLWAVGGPMGLTGGCLQWFAEAFGRPGETPADAYERLNRQAATVPPGADGLLALPNLAGARTPLWLPAARGAFVGIAPQHTSAHFARAILEGVALQIGQLLQATEALGVRSREVRLVGGGARSALWTQIRADVLGRPVLVPAVTEASSLGAALLAGVACGLFADPQAASQQLVHIATTHGPDLSAADVYRARRADFDRLTEALRPLFGSS